MVVGRRLTVDDAMSDSDDDPAKGWEVIVTRDGARESRRYAGATLDIVVPECDGLDIRRLPDVSGINSPAEELVESLTAPLTLYDMSGRKLGTVAGIREAKRFSGVCIIVDAEGKTVKLKL